MEQNPSNGRTSKTRSYLLYAVGEIALVMIGILLALQVSNWNELRKEQQVAIEYHKQIIQDLNRFEQQTNILMNGADEVIKLVVQAVDFLEAKELKKGEQEVFDRAIRRFYQYNYQNPELPTLQEMKSTGDMRLIKNKELLDELLDLEARTNSVNDIYMSLGNRVQEKADYVDTYTRSYVDTSLAADDFNVLSFKADFKSMAADEEFINHFSRFAVYWRASKMFSYRLKNSAISLKEAFEQELAELES